MIADSIQMTASLAMLYLGAEALVRGASALASGLGVSALSIGLTIVAFGTSAPELVVSLDAALAGANDISVGNVVGSNIANIALILGLGAVLRPCLVHTKLVRVDAPIMIAASLALAVILANEKASRIEGLLLIIAFAGYSAFTFWEATRESEAVRDELTSVTSHRFAGVPMNGALVVVGLALLAGGGHLLVASAVRLATFLGVSEAAIGLTIVAVGTSLPELATTVLASIRGQGDIAIGNVVGSNIFNITGILGLTAIVHPLEMGGITWIDLGTMLALACLLTFLISIRRRLGRAGGALLLVFFVLYTSWLLAA